MNHVTYILYYIYYREREREREHYVIIRHIAKVILEVRERVTLEFVFFKVQTDIYKQQTEDKQDTDEKGLHRLHTSHTNDTMNTTTTTITTVV
jgi:hypothetical protein